MKPIVYTDYGSWKMCMNTMVAQIDRMLSFIWKHKPGMKSNSTTECKQSPCRKFTFSPFLDLVLDCCLKFILFSSILKSAQTQVCVTCNSLQDSPFFSQSVLKGAKYGRRVYKINRAFFASLTSFLASLQTSSLNVRARRLHQVPQSDKNTKR